jgi:hypothetical protein
LPTGERIRDKIVRKPADGIAYALSVAEKYALIHDRLRRRLDP